MDQSLTLTVVEVYDLTRKRRPSAQIQALRGMSLEHRCWPDGSVAVLREHVLEVLGGKWPAKRKIPVKRAEINWED